MNIEKRQIEYIDFDKIEPVYEKIDSLWPDETDRQYEAALKLQCLLPIIVDESYKIIDGNFRFCIAHMMQLKKVPCIVISSYEQVEHSNE